MGVYIRMWLGSVHMTETLMHAKEDYTGTAFIHTSTKTPCLKNDPKSFLVEVM